jgi:hypothetical protein
MAENDFECFMRDTMSDEYLCHIYKPAPQVVIDPKKPRSNPFSLTDQWIASGDLKEGLLKIRLNSESGDPLPGHFTSQFAKRDLDSVFKSAMNEPALKIRMFDISSHALVKDRVYRKTFEPVTWTGTFEGLLRTWQDNQLLHFNNDPLPHEELASIFRNFRRDNKKTYPYIVDWSCSLFRIHYVDPKKSASWQRQHNFGVSLWKLSISSFPGRGYLILCYICCYLNISPFVSKEAKINSNTVKPVYNVPLYNIYLFIRLHTRLFLLIQIG